MENKDYPELEGTASPMDSQDEIFAAIESSVEDAIAQEDMMAAIESSVEQAIAREFSDEASAEDASPAEALPDPEETFEVEEPAADKAAAATEEAVEEIIIPTLPIVEESSGEAPSAPFDLSVPEDPALDAAEEESPAAEELSDENLTDSRFLGEDADFQEEFQAAPTEEPAPVKERSVRKGRPRRKKGELFFGIPQIAVTCVWLAIILVTGVTLGRMLWVCAADILAFGREEKIVTVTVYESDSMEDITDKLHKAGLIRYPGLFNIYASLAVDEGEIQPGIWDLNTVYDYHALVNMMSPSSSRTIVEDVLIPEGFTCRQIFQLLEEKRICTAKDLAEYAANGELKDYWFLEGLERGYEYCLEGFLFPDTYDFYKNSSPRDVLEKLLDNFEYRFNDEMRAQIETLNANVTGGTFD
ncbi:MAG: endolytic transglycosylase MltG, partial [Firmicutes bacterium]|nr:endolytic transglycosylase MltG [Bacillota bacterium]